MRRAPGARARRRDGPRRRQGRDATLASSSARRPNGIVTTQRLDDVLATQPDAAIHSGMVFDLELITTLLRAGVNVYTGIGGYYLPGSPDFDIIDTAGARRRRVVHRGWQHPRIDQRRVAAVRHRLHRSHPPDPRAAGATTCRPTRRGRRSSRSASARKVAADAEVRGDVRRAASPARSASRRTWSPTASASSAPTACSRRSASSSRRTTSCCPTSGARGRAGQVAGIEWTWAATVGRPRSSSGVTNQQTAALGLGPGWRETPRGPALGGRDRRRAIDRRDVRVAARDSKLASRRSCSTCRAR